MESELRKAAQSICDKWDSGKAMAHDFIALKAALSAQQSAPRPNDPQAILTGGTVSQPTQAHRPEQDAAVEAVKLLLYERFGILADAQPATDQIIAAVRKADAK